MSYIVALINWLNSVKSNLPKKSVTGYIAEFDGCSKSSYSVATIHSCHRCQIWALVSGNERSACQTPFRPRAGGFFFSFFLYAENLEHLTGLAVCVKVH